MSKQIEHINTIIRRLKTKNIANIQEINKLKDDTLFYDFVRGRHINVKKLFSLYERIEEKYD
jgi:phosphoglycerate dehydrogenase-like enzyme